MFLLRRCQLSSMRQRRINFNRENDTILFEIRLNYANLYIASYKYILLAALILILSFSFSSVEPWIWREPFRCFREQLRMVFASRDAWGQAELDRSTAILQCMTLHNSSLNIYFKQQTLLHAFRQEQVALVMAIRTLHHCVVMAAQFLCNRTHYRRQAAAVWNERIAVFVKKFTKSKLSRTFYLDKSRHCKGNTLYWYLLKCAF